MNLKYRIKKFQNRKNPGVFHFKIKIPVPVPNLFFKDFKFWKRFFLICSSYRSPNNASDQRSIIRCCKYTRIYRYSFTLIFVLKLILSIISSWLLSILISECQMRKYILYKYIKYIYYKSYYFTSHNNKTWKKKHILL